MRFPFFRNRDSVKNGILISIRRTGDGFHPGLFKAIITLNWPQAVLRFHFAEQQAEGKVFIEEVNEGEKL